MSGKFDVKKGSSGDARFAINTTGSLNAQTELLLQSSRYAATQLTGKSTTFMKTKTLSQFTLQSFWCSL